MVQIEDGFYYSLSLLWSQEVEWHFTQRETQVEQTGLYVLQSINTLCGPNVVLGPPKIVGKV